MKKYLITKTKFFDYSDYNVINDFQKVLYEIGRHYMLHDKHAKIFYDAEASGLDPYLAEMLLSGFVINDCAFVVLPDMLDGMNSIMHRWKECTLIGHNIKYDHKLLKVAYPDTYETYNFYDTEIADRRIYQGLGISAKNIKGLYFNLNAVTQRYCPDVTRSSKDIRKQFIGVKRKHYAPTKEQVDYLFDDVIHLPAIVKEQVAKLKKADKLKFFLDVEMPLIEVLSDMEVYGGFDFDVEKWKQNIEVKEKAAYEAELSLDKEFKRLRDTLLSSEERKPITGGIYDMSRTKLVDVSLDLFGQPKKLASKFKAKKPININWGSDLQIKKLFAHLRLPLPCENGYFIPVIFNNEIDLALDGVNKKNYAIEKENVKVLKGLTLSKLQDALSNGVIFDIKLTVGIPKMKAMLKMISDHPAKDFIGYLETYSESTTKVKNYGQNYIDKIHSVTGKIHTIYRQCHAITGRLQSGGGKNDPHKINSQNIPRDNMYRTCFHGGEDYNVVTCDLSGAETVIMADKAHDMVLYDLAIKKDDIHSPVAQTCWRNVHLFRAGTYSMFWSNSKEFWEKKESFSEVYVTPKGLEDYNKSKELIITKIINKLLRTDFKAITFGTVYGMYAKKCANQLNISIEEGQIIIDTIKRMIPATFEMVENNVIFGMGIKSYNGWQRHGKGYVILNNYSNNTVFLPPIYNLRKYKIEPEFRDIKEWEGVCRNAPIQGTQADMLKLAMVRLYKYIKDKELDAFIMIQVHDELVVKYNKKYKDTKFEYNNKQLSFAEIVQHHMIDAANEFLSDPEKFISMKADYEDTITWVK